MVSRRNQKRRKSRRMKRKSHRSQRGGGFQVSRQDICKVHVKELNAIQLDGTDESYQTFLTYLLTWMTCPDFKDRYMIADNELRYPASSETIYILKDGEKFTEKGKFGLRILLDVLKKVLERKLNPLT